MPFSRVTVGVCGECGVQSPPIFIIDEKEIAPKLIKQGWKVTTHEFNRVCLCPQCQTSENAAQEKTN